MWWMYLGLAASLIKKGMKWKDQATSFQGPGGKTIVGEEWGDLAGVLVEAFADAFGLSKDEAMMGLFEGLAAQVDTSAYLTKNQSTKGQR